MKAALSIVLAGLLVTTPLKLVLAQAAQQEAATVQQTAPDSSGHRLIGVPPVTDNTSRLWKNPADRARLNTELSDGLFVQRGELSIGAQVAIAIVVIAVGLLIFVAIIKRAGQATIVLPEA